MGHLPDRRSPTPTRCIPILASSILLFLITCPVPAAPGGNPAENDVFKLQTWPPAPHGKPAASPAADPASGDDPLAAYTQVRSAAFMGWSPGGIHILTRMGPHPQFHHVSAPLADRRQETFFRRRVDQWYANPVPGKRQVLISMDDGGDEAFTLRLLDLASNRILPLACPPGRVTSVLWNDSGTAYLYSHTPSGTDRWDIRLGSPGGRDTLLLSRGGTWSPMDWSADGSQAVLQKYVSSSESELHILSLPGGEVTRVLPKDAVQYYDHAVWVRLPETGKTLGLAFTSDRDGGSHRLYLLRAGEEKPVALSPRAPWDVEWVAAGGDRRTLIYSLNEQGVSILHAQRPGVTPMKAVRLPGIPRGIIEGVVFHPSGKEFGFTVNHAAFPGDAFSYRLDQRRAIRWTESETAGLPREGFREPQLIHYPTFDSVDGARRMIPAWLYLPGPAQPRPTGPGVGPDGPVPGAPGDPVEPVDSDNPDSRGAGAERAPVPVLVQIHGGPEQQARAGFDPFIQYLTGRLGMAVILPNVRGSSGYGREYLEADDGYLRPGAVRDIGALLDWIGTRPDLDSSRVAVAGRSYGGFMALASLTRYGNRLKGGISTVGITHFPTFLKETSGYRRDLRRMEYGDERDPKMAAFLDSLSPSRHIDKIIQPLLLCHGRNDPRVPFAESARLFEMLKSRRIPVWLLSINNEGHAFRSEPAQLAHYRIMADFLRSTFPVVPPHYRKP